MTERENFKSRLGFILIAAGCAIGLGNVWRFPFITGQYGGAAFVLIYLFFLLIFGFPILVMEFAVGRSSKRGVGRSFAILEKPGHKWHYAGIPMIAGNYLLMMFYTTVTGWMLYYFYRMVARKWPLALVLDGRCNFCGAFDCGAWTPARCGTHHEDDDVCAPYHYAHLDGSRAHAPGCRRRP